MEPASKAAYGWYPDPSGRSELRWWDGSRWTGYTSSSGSVSEDEGPRDAPSPSGSSPDPGPAAAAASSSKSGSPSGYAVPAAGWYRDPYGSNLERWWDGEGWSELYRKHAAPASRSRQILSLPVFLCGIPVLLMLISYAFYSPVSFVLAALVAGMTALPLIGAFVWLDRIQPEPLEERVHALLWGASVPVIAALLLSLPLEMIGASELVLMVVAAPLAEELGKGLGVLFIARRARIDSMMDGVVYAGWVAAGFAIVEDVLYYFTAYMDMGMQGLAVVGIGRGVVSLYAHPLMTLPIGVAVAWAVANGLSTLRWAAAGYIPAVALHALWNGSLWAEFALVAYLLFFVPLFVVSSVLLLAVRRRGMSALSRHVPRLALVYGLTAQEVAAFSSWETKLRLRRQLPPDSRRSFDALHGAVARLVAMEEWKTPPSPDRRRAAVEKLWEARASM